MTTMDFTLSPALSEELAPKSLPPGGNGIYAYAVDYVGGNFSSYITLVSNGTPTGVTKLPIAAGASGRQYVVIQHEGDKDLPTHLKWALGAGGITGDIGRDSALKYNYQYQLFEGTLTPSSNDVGDISALDTFGLPSKYEVSYSDGTSATRGFAPNITGNQIYDAAKAANPLSVQKFKDGTNSLAIGPGASGLDNPWKGADWTQYVTQLKNAPATLADIRIVVPFGGSPVQAAASLSIYGVTYESSTDTFVLTPDSTYKSMPGVNTDYIRVTSSVLQDAIYKQVGAIQTSLTGLPGSYTTAGAFTPNTADGGVAKFFIGGFDAGYWGGSASSPNRLDPTVSHNGQKYADDLNKSWNWNFNNAYNATLNDKIAVNYDNVLGSGPGTATGARYYDPWAKEIVQLSNSYGWPYSDQISQGGVNPQISLWDSGLRANVNKIAVTLYSNSEVLPSTSGFEASSTGYVPPPIGPGTYSPVNKAHSAAPLAGEAASQIGFSFNFTAGSYSFAPSDKTHAWFRFYAPGDPQAGSDKFVSIPIPKMLDPATGKVSIWNQLYVHHDNNKWTLEDYPAWAAPVPNTNPSSGTKGAFNIFSLPTVSDNTTSWYQLQFGDGAHQTVYNIYSAGPASAPTQFAVDHAVSVTRGTFSNEFLLDFANAGAMVYDPFTFLVPGHIKGTEGDDVLVGTGADDTFYNGGGNDTVDGGSGSDTVAYWPSPKNYTMKVVAGSPTVTLQDKVGIDGTVRLVNVEAIEFGGMSRFLLKIAQQALSVAEPMRPVRAVQGWS